MDPLLGIAVGIGLSAAAGFRAFVPLLLLSLAARAGSLTLSPGMEWIASDAALTAFATATILEIGAYYIPWLDTLLDSIATPAAVTAGVIAAAAMIPDLPPLLRWAIAIIAGGSAAGLVQAATVLLRLQSSLWTGGLANPAVATIEWLGAVVVSLLAIFVPLLGVVVAGLLLLAGARRALRVRRGRRNVGASHA